MTNVQAITLGFVQGLTEYLPVSSSAHLVLFPSLLGWEFVEKESFVFDILVQLGTLFGVFAYFFIPLKEVVRSVLYGLAIKKPFHNEDAKLGWMVALASIPAAFFGFTFKNEFPRYFSSPTAACYFLILTGIFLILAELIGRSLKENPSWRDATLIGFAQSFALLPGVSRSGATIAAGMACGLPRKNAARFSFLMSIPVLIGASMVAAFELFSDKALLSSLAMPLILGFFSAAITGYFVIKWFMNFLTNRSLSFFAAYCIAIGVYGAWFF